MISLLSEAVVPGGDQAIPFLPYLNLGVIVAVLIGILVERGPLMQKWVHNKIVDDLQAQVAELKAEKSAAEARVAQLRDKMEDDVLPQLWKTTEVLAHVMEHRQER